MKYWLFLTSQVIAKSFFCYATSVHGKKIDAPKPLKKRIKKYGKLSKSLSKKLRVLKDMKKLDWK